MDCPDNNLEYPIFSSANSNISTADALNKAKLEHAELTAKVLDEECNQADGEYVGTLNYQCVSNTGTQELTANSISSVEFSQPYSQNEEYADLVATNLAILELSQSVAELGCNTGTNPFYFASATSSLYCIPIPTTSNDVYLNENRSISYAIGYGWSPSSQAIADSNAQNLANQLAFKYLDCRTQDADILYSDSISKDLYLKAAGGNTPEV